MEVVHLNQKQLAARWNLSEATRERWRSEGLGPKFLKLCGRVIYRQVDLKAYEEPCLATSTKTVAAQTSVVCTAMDRDSLGDVCLASLSFCRKPCFSAERGRGGRAFCSEGRATAVTWGPHPEVSVAMNGTLQGGGQVALSLEAGAWSVAVPDPVAAPAAHLTCLCRW